MIDGKNIFDQLIKNNLITHEDNQKIATGQRDDDTTGCLVNYNYFKNYYKMIAIYLSKQKAHDVDLRAIQQINFTSNLDQGEKTIMFFIIEEAGETILYFLQGIVKVLSIYFTLI